MDVTRTPLALRIVPILLATIPLPTPLITPPITSMYFIFWYSIQFALSQPVNWRQTVIKPKFKLASKTAILTSSVNTLNCSIEIANNKYQLSRMNSHNTLPHAHHAVHRFLYSVIWHCFYSRMISHCDTIPAVMDTRWQTQSIYHAYIMLE